MSTMVTQNVPVGAKKPRGIGGTLFALFFMILLMGMVMSWFFWNGARDNDRLFTYGKEVRTTVSGYEQVTDTVDNNDGTYTTVIRYRTYFLYIDDESDDFFKGYCDAWTKEKDAASQIGKEITVVIDFERHDYRVGTKDSLKSKFNGNMLFKVCIALTAVFCASLVIFCIGVYRTQIHKGICRKVGGNNSSAILDEDCLITGEVIAAFGLLWYYVRVKYRDENDKERCGWANSHFTHTEANFLREKRFVQIATYYKAFDIVEQMPVNKTVKTK